ncbi:mitochondrial ribosomal subunit protein-domain-containing protein [Biscogniauxia mediterranea]|nr:mitochondrial ribosomal subunit protein-domain-containing protein [Biscogniauxia mediterranea]
MASAVPSLRPCLRLHLRLRTTLTRTPVPVPVPVSRSLARSRSRLYPPTSTRTLSTTSTTWRPAAKKDDIDRIDDELDEEDEDDGITVADMERALRQAGKSRDSEVESTTKLQEQTIGAASDSVSSMLRLPRMNLKRSFWNEEEDDPELITDELNEDEFDEDDIPSMAHGKLEEIREYREYARLAAWEMPLLSKLARPFEPPTLEEPLRFRYTTYMGEFHPAESKVVVEFSPQDMPLNDAQKLKLKKLLGPRYNHDTDIAKMSCEQFEHQAQNKRYLGDLVNKLLEKAKDPTDMFEDVALDTRHTKTKTRPQFPTEWRMTEERQKFLAKAREAALLIDQEKEKAGKLIDGTQSIKNFFESQADKERLPEHVTAALERKLPSTPPRPTPRPSLWG